MPLVPYTSPTPPSMCVCAVSVYFVFNLEPFHIQFHLSGFSIQKDADISWDFFALVLYSAGKSPMASKVTSWGAEPPWQPYPGM